MASLDIPDKGVGGSSIEKLTHEDIDGKEFKCYFTYCSMILLTN